MKKILTITLACLTLSGCATIVSGNQQSIFVDTPYVEGANCDLVDSKAGKWHLKETPGATTVTKGNGPMNITCEKKGYKTTTVTLEEGFAGATLGNVIAGGGIGLLVDAASGAAQIYPDKAVVWMEPLKWKNEKQKKEWQAAKAEYEAEEQRKKEEEEARKAKQRKSSND